MSNCSILRIGPVGCDTAAALRSAIASHFRSHRDSSSSATNNNNDDGVLLTISNRYFDANAILAPLDESVGSADHEEEDGILLVFDSASSSSFDALSRHHSCALHNGQDGELIRLCIGATRGPSPLSDGSKKSEEEYSRRVLWCLDRGYEYVEVDLTPEGMERGFDERDKDGFARVVEAIGTCMWSSRVMKPRGHTAGGRAGLGLAMAINATASSNNDGEKAVKKDVTNNDNESGEAQSDVNKKEAESIPSSATDLERGKAAMTSLMQGVKSNEQPQTGDSDISANNNKSQHQPQEQLQQQDEIAFSQLESVLSEARSIREASKNNLGSDEERRERAGDTALKLMGLLDRLGLDIGGDDSEECDSSDDEQ